MWSVNGIRELLRFARKHDGPWEYECKDDEFLPHEEDAPVIAAAPDMLKLLAAIQNIVPESPYKEKVKAIIAQVK